jgi:hypothetical protein
LQELNWRLVRAVLWVLAVGVALGLLLLIPPVHLPPAQVPASVHGAIRSHPPAPQRPLWASILLVIGLGAPLLALALGLLALPVLLRRAVWLRRQRDLHLAIGRQGLLFFLPGQAGRWFLLPWGHMTALTDVTTTPRNGRRARLRTVRWRRLARFQRVFRHGRRLGAESGKRPSARSPFLLRARAARPQERLRVACYARLPDSGYSWLFGLAPFTRRVGPGMFLLETGWFESAAPRLPAAQGAKQPAPPGASLHRVLLGLWRSPLLRAQRSTLPLPRTGGAVILNAPAPVQKSDVAARLADRAAWAALPLVPVLSVVGVGITLVRRQPLETGAVLNLATLCVLTLGLGLLLAGVQRATRGRLFAFSAFVLALAGTLNLAYGVVALLFDWPWSFQLSPGEPFLFLEALAGLLLLMGGAALGLEGSGRPGCARPAPSQHAQVGLRARSHSTELVVALGLLTLGLARVLENINLAVLSSDSANTLQWLRNTLAEPLLPLAIIGLSYFILLASPALQSLFRILQAVYGGVLALLVPVAFILVFHATGGKGLLPLEWLLLIVLELVFGLLVLIYSLAARRQRPATLQP